MNNPRKQIESRYSARRKKILSSIKGDVAFFASAPQLYYSRDTEVPYKQNTNFYYLTGFQETNSILVLRGHKKPSSILYMEEKNPLMEVWVGPRLGLKAARRRFSVDDIRPIENLRKDFKELVRGSSHIHYSLKNSHMLDEIILDHIANPNNPRFNESCILKDASLLTAPLRLIKDKDEINLCKHAAQITARSLKELIPFLAQMKNEKQTALSLESLFAKYGAQGTAFNTIVAAGRNATTLHHTPGFSPLWKKELVLIDCGADFQGYSGDITRVFPVSGSFTSEQAAVYDVVHNALSVGIAKVKTGISLDDIHEVVSKEITKGLIDLKILKGNYAQAYEKGSYKKYYMHRTGHWLGLDVHDISPATFNNQNCHSYLFPLEPGMVFTIEPGLYFNPLDESIPKHFRGIGIRLEEDILVTSKGVDVISKDIPLDRIDIEKLF